MAAAMNGLALYGGYIPYGGTFLVFSDYSRPAIRLAALMGVGVIHVLTHDSIGLGEDGPTHQPIEHLASLRAMPNLLVFRPCDEAETAESWACAVQHRKMPSVLALSRQNLAYVRQNFTEENLVSKGAYILQESQGNSGITLYASGSEVEIIVSARDILKETYDIDVRIVSVPCMELFFKQSKAYQDSILSGTVRIAVEAGVKQGWEVFISDNDAFIGMQGFGASAPAPVLYEKFGITKEAVIAKVLQKIGYVSNIKDKVVAL
jgi:transketolase